MSTVPCPRCNNPIPALAAVCPSCGAALARQQPAPARPAGGPSHLALALPAWVTVAAVVFGVLWLVLVGSDKPVVATQKVLIVKLADDDEKPRPVESFDEALENGGQVVVKFETIRDAHPEIETFSPMKDGSYLTFGALVNFVASKGWSFHGLEMGGLVVFVR